jgi:release factor glutamine methyltransferase
LTATSTSSSSRWRRKTRHAVSSKRKAPLSETRAAQASRTLLDVVRLSTGYLAERGISSARLEAELLCAHSLGLRRIDLYLQFERNLDGAELASIRELLRRRGRGEPVAYITGEREFFGRAYRVTPDVLVPRPETEVLVDRALRVLRASPNHGALRVADLGTGSGCIAVTLAAELPQLSVIATDVSEAVLDVARSNAERHGVIDRVTFVRTSWADGLDALDTVISNPPYVTVTELNAADRDVRDFEPALALLGGDDGLDAYRALAASLQHRIRPAGTVLLEVDTHRAGAVGQIMSVALPDGEATTHSDLTGRARILELQRRPS